MRKLLFAFILSFTLLTTGCTIVNTRVMEIPGSDCKRVVLTIEEEIGEGQIIRREEAVILCWNDNIGEWEVIDPRKLPPVGQAIHTLMSMVGL